MLIITDFVGQPTFFLFLFSVISLRGFVNFKNDYILQNISGGVLE